MVNIAQNLGAFSRYRLQVLSNFSDFEGGSSIQFVVGKAGRLEMWSRRMFGLLSAASVVMGSALALGAKSLGAKWHPLGSDTLETCAGAFLILGFGLLGSVLPH